VRRLLILLLFCFVFGLISVAPRMTGVHSAQVSSDPELSAYIAKIKAIDNHAHPARNVSPGEKPDDEYDALPLEGLEDFALPIRMRPENPDFIGAWKSLFGYTHNEMDKANVDRLIDSKHAIMQKQGENYPAWVLDQLGIETMLANRVAMGKSVTSPRFLWVPFVDALMLPLNTESFRKINPDNRVFFTGEDRLLKRYLSESKISSLPLTLDGYQTKVVTATLERQKQGGAVAVKFEAAYLRALDFDEPQKIEAERVYARYQKGGIPSIKEYKVLQDYLFRYIAREAGRLGMAVHIHVLDNFGSYYRASNSNVELLEPVFNDPSLRKTNFVILHGGYPLTKTTAAYIGKANVYVDFSNQGLTLYPRALSEELRNWLEYFPEKVLFGTDAFPLTPAIGWEETGWLSTKTGREALTLALSGMMNDGEITRQRAQELARMVLRENAIKLYDLKTH
jgi:predicted TIM-barrel fold metal-dependent hydrolase